MALEKSRHNIRTALAVAIVTFRLSLTLVAVLRTMLAAEDLDQSVDKTPYCIARITSASAILWHTFRTKIGKRGLGSILHVQRALCGVWKRCSTYVTCVLAVQRSSEKAIHVQQLLS